MKLARPHGRTTLGVIREHRADFFPPTLSYGIAVRGVITSRGHSIAYRVEGAGASILLLAGLSQWADQWFDAGYDQLLNGYQLIALDRLGHGDSDRPVDPAMYAEPLIVQDAIAVLEHLGVTSAVIWGFSLGAKNAMSLAVLHPSVVAAVICGSNTDMTSPETSTRRMLRLADACADASGVRGFLRAVGVTDENEVADFLAHNSQPATLAACLRGTVELWVDPADVHAPMLWYVGEGEGGFRPGELDAGHQLDVEMHVTPSPSHVLAFQQAAEVCRVVIPFLRANTMHLSP